MQPANEITPEALLANASWMRALARGLLGDAHEADDVVQEAALAALRGAPAGGTEPRAWLARVVRNAAWRRLRTRARREAREQRAARPESQPPPQSETLERLELQEQLLKAVRALDEPLRTTVVQRYFEGRSSAEIARAAGLPEGTVRWRLKRGLELLRERLDRRVGRESWSLLFAPLVLRDVAAPVSTGAAAAGTSTWILQGAIAMGTWKLVGVTAAAAVLGLAWWTFGSQDAELSTARGEVVAAAPDAASGGPGPAATEVRAPSTRARVARPVAPGEGAAPSPAPAQSAAPASSTGVLLARFVDEVGGAWPGVTLRQLALARRFDPQARGLEVAAAADGRARLEVALPPASRSGDGAARWRHEFVVSGAGCATEKLSAYVTSGEATDLGDVVLSRGARISGRVLDESGAAVEGALVGAVDAELPDDLGRLARRGDDAFDPDLAQRSSKDGSFLLEGVELGTRRVWSHARGMRYGWSAALEVLESPDLRDVSVVLTPLATKDRVTGRVLDPNGRPAPHASIEVFERGPDHQSIHFETSGPDGSFELVAEHADSVFDLTAKDLTAGTQVSAQGVAPGTLDLELRLAPPGELEVRVHDPYGEPVSNVVFEVTSGFVGGDALSVETAPGEHRVPYPDSEFNLTVSAPGHRTTSELGLRPQALPAVLELTLQPTAQIVGIVLAEGAPVVGAKVEVREHDEDARMIVNGLRCVQSSFPASSGKTDSQGRFALDLDLSGSFWVRAVAPGWAACEAGPFEVAYVDGSEVVELELTRGGSIEGYLLAGPDERIEGRFIAVSHGDGAARTQRLGPDGFYRFEGLTPGAWQVLEVPEELGPHVTSYGTYSRDDPIPWTCTVELGRTTRADVDLTGS